MSWSPGVKGRLPGAPNEGRWRGRLPRAPNEGRWRHEVPVEKEGVTASPLQSHAVSVAFIPG